LFLIVATKMAMPPPGNVTTPSEKLQFPPPANWIPDERDGFISWLRAEFAAANAIIDSLCQHLQAVGDHNEYESVIGSIHHRRLAWSQVLTMQQFFPVADVSYNLQQIAWKRQQQMPPQRHYNSDQVGKFGARRSGPGFNKHHGGGGGYRGADSMARNGHNFNGVNSDRVEHREEAKLASDVKALSVAEEKRGNQIVFVLASMLCLLVRKVNLFVVKSYLQLFLRKFIVCC
jgi:hypothetical protein